MARTAALNPVQEVAGHSNDPWVLKNTVHSGEPGHLDQVSPRSPGAWSRSPRSNDSKGGWSPGHTGTFLASPTSFGTVFFDDKTSVRGRVKNYVSMSKKTHEQRYKTGVGHPFPRVLRLHRSKGFEACIALLIVANCVAIGWQAEQRDPDDMTLLFIEVLDHFFTAAFLLELLLTGMAMGWTILVKSECFLDIFLVTLGVTTTWIMKPLEHPLTKILRKLTVLRILRLLRLARAVRMRPEFKEMWALLKGVAESGETLFWTYVMIFCVLYFFAIMATSLIGKSDTFREDELAQEHFGDVLLSMMTLFQVMTLDSWTSIMRPLMKQQPLVVLFFVVFISIAEFVLMNLITAVIVEHAFADSKNEQNELAKEMEGEMEKELRELQHLFNRMDTDGDRKLSRSEFTRAMESKKVRQKLQKLDIVAKDIDELWEILDDGDGELDSQEFVNGIRRLRGEARFKDILRLYREIRVLENFCDQVEENLEITNERMQAVQGRLQRARLDVAAAQRTMMRAKEAVKLAAVTQPLQ
jgi:hypothetical protein